MIRMRASEFRLMLAVGICVVLFVATPSSPTSSDSCYEHKDHGSIIVDNPNGFPIKIAIGGKGEFTIPMQDSRKIVDFEPKEYLWSAYGECYYASANEYVKEFFCGKIKVKKDETSRINIPRRGPN